MVGQNLSVFALYDSDSAGETAKGKLIKNWLARYAGRKAVAFSLGEILGTIGKECSIEDLFPENFYVKRVHEVYSKQLAAAGADLEELPAGDQLSKRLEATFAAAGVKYNKGSVCKVLCRDLREMKNLRELPTDTAEKAKAIFAAIEKGIFKLFKAMSSAQIVQKLWYDCNILRDDGLLYGEYVEQLT